MNKGISKWPSKVLNLLVVLSMVIALCAVLAPAIAVADEECNPTQTYGGCHLVVDVNTYTKDANGDFAPVYSVGVDTCYYVNAVVVNNGNDTAGHLNATLGINGAAELDSDCDQNLVQSWADQINKNDDLLAGEVADFWWKVCCNGVGTATFSVTASANDGVCHNTDGITVKQGVSEEEKCVEIRIVEAPGLPATVVGRLGNYTNTFPGTVIPCQNFGIKAEITNLCEAPLENVNGTITITGTASLVGDNPGGQYHEWNLGNIEPGETEVVAWTVHCDAPGDANIKVELKGYDLSTNYFIGSTSDADGWMTVDQLGQGELEVLITEPGDCTKIGQGDACGDNIFPIQVKVTNNRDQAALSVFVTIAGNDSDLLSFLSTPGTIASLGDLEPGEIAYANFLGRCKDAGSVMLTATATAGGLDPVTDTQVVSQNDVIAKVLSVTARDPGGNYWVNVCQKFDVIADFSNYSGAGRIFQTYIYWTGNATLLFGDGYDPQFDRQLAGIGWEDFGTGTSQPVNTLTPGNASAGWSNYQTPPTICDCCDTQVRWTFQCTGTEDVQLYVKMVDALTGITYVDESLTCPGVTNVYQEWKAHLIAGLTAFIQDDCGVMLNRTAFAPGQDFHVVIPVVNTGDANAENVVVTYLVSGSGTYTYISTSGDKVSASFAGGVGTVNLGTIYGYGSGYSSHTKKAILQFHCTGEGSVSILITGMSGLDENTNKAIAENNKIYPICPTLLKQIPFKVEIQNPYTCQNFKMGANFAVKALITNDSTFDLGNVSAKVYWEGPAALVDYPTQTATKDVGNATDHSVLAGTQHEITWEFVCTDAGDVTFWVTTTALDPYLTAITDEVVTVHQLSAPYLEVKVLSPVAIHTMIATGEQFAVTAMVANWGSQAAEDVQVAIGDYDEDMYVSRTNGTFSLNDSCITPGSEVIWVDDVEQVRGVDYVMDNYAFGYGHFLSGHIPGEDAVVDGAYLDQFSLVSPSEMVQDIGTLGEYETKIVTWTMRAETTCDGGCMVDDEPLWVTAWGSNAEYAYAYPPFVDIYPAAHLVTVIGTVTPVVNVCDEFNVSYTVYNIGQADAWNTSVTLSVEPAGSVRIAGGETGYTQMLGTIPGYDSGALEQRGYAEGTFKLHCKMACESTITITPAGYDECGIHFVQAEINDIGIGGSNGSGPEFIGYAEEPGRAIDQKFLEPASKTVKQVVSGGVDLSIDKAADNLFPETGQTVKFTVVVTNNGPADATGIVVSDAIPVGLTMSGYIKTQGTYAGGVWTVGSLNAGSSATLVITCTRLASPSGAITNTATITALGQVDPFSNNNTDLVTLNKAEVTSWPIALKSGWNLISLPLIPTNSAIATVLSGVSSHVASVYYYDAGTASWQSWTPAIGGSLATMEDGKGYWINMNAAATLTVNGVVNPLPDSGQTPPSYTLVGGKWNLIGFKSTIAMTASDYLGTDMVGKWARIWGYANGQYSAVVSSGMLQPGYGYWIAVTSAGTIYP